MRKRAQKRSHRAVIQAEQKAKTKAMDRTEFGNHIMDLNFTLTCQTPANVQILQLEKTESHILLFMPTLCRSE